MIKREPIIKFLVLSLTFSKCIQANAQNDSSKVLSEVTITEATIRRSVERLPEVQGTYIFSGKKTEVLNLARSNANLTDKIARQVFAQIPGIFVYDMDGTGNQINIATRGLDPHRGWEFNIRQNGFLSNTDMYGYPASHYVVPLEAVERIEMVRGTGSLQYGAQFGGMLNYITRHADSTRKFSGKAVQSIGSFNSLSSFISVDGRIGKVQYDAYYNRRISNGYRNDAASSGEAFMLQMTWNISNSFTLIGQVGRSYYLYHMPGPLNDSMFNADPRASSRKRNYYTPDIYIPAISTIWKPNEKTTIQWNLSAVLGARNSVMFDKPSNIPDKLDSATLQYAARQVDIDKYHSYTSELRILREYAIGKRVSTIAAGVQYMNNDLHRMQQGKGSTGSDWDLRLQPGSTWGRDMHLLTSNVALFAENHLQLNKNLSLNLGARYENGRSDMKGKIAYIPDNQVPATIRHKFPLFGISFQYNYNKNTAFYGGWSQAYRPVIFKDIIPTSVYERVSPNLKDAYGYNGELGFRGESGRWKWDVSLFQLIYHNRMGTQSTKDSLGQYYVLHSNIGDSRNRGIEFYLRYNLRISKYAIVSIFNSTALMQAIYTNGEVRSQNENISIAGNKVESAPQCISRTGFNFIYRRFSGNILCSYTAKSFADPLNSVTPDAAGTVGIVPSYTIWDATISYHISSSISCRFSVNNFTDVIYFTKRPQFYPGPGVWPSDGRSFQASVSLNF